MESTSEEYRRKAEEAEEWATNSSDPIVAARFLHLAEQWRELADMIDRRKKPP